jgi:hypothetical protein
MEIVMNLTTTLSAAPRPAKPDAFLAAVNAARHDPRMALLRRALDAGDVTAALTALGLASALQAVSRA